MRADEMDALRTEATALLALVEKANGLPWRAVNRPCEFYAETIPAHIPYVESEDCIIADCGDPSHDGDRDLIVAAVSFAHRWAGALAENPPTGRAPEGA